MGTNLLTNQQPGRPIGNTVWVWGRLTSPTWMVLVDIPRISNHTGDFKHLEKYCDLHGPMKPENQISYFHSVSVRRKTGYFKEFEPCATHVNIKDF